MLADPVGRENHGTRSLAAIFDVRFSSPEVPAAQTSFDPARAETLVREATGPGSC